MNLDGAALDLANRALLSAGNQPLTEADRAAQNAAWVSVKAFYLSTLLECLAQVAWTSARRRRVLMRTQRLVKKNPEYAFAYDLPLDCAKPVKLTDNDFFVVERGVLYTNEPRAALLYITNGKRLPDQEAIDTAGAFMSPHDEYITGGDAFTDKRYENGDNIIFGGDAFSDVRWGRDGVPSQTPPRPAVLDEDYPDYFNVAYESQFALYFEKMLCAKFAMKITDKPELHMAFLQEAMTLGREAERASIAQNAAARKSEPLWTESLGTGRRGRRGGRSGLLRDDWGQTCS